MRRTFLLATAAALALAVFSGCPSVEARKAIVNCKFNLKAIRVHSVNPLNLRMTVVLGVYNPNDIDVIVDRFEYTVFVNGLKAAMGDSPGNLTIPVNQERDLPVNVRANGVDVARVAMSVRQRRRGANKLTVRGTVYVRVAWGEYPFPVKVSRSF